MGHETTTGAETMTDLTDTTKSTLDEMGVEYWDEDGRWAFGDSQYRFDVNGPMPTARAIELACAEVADASRYQDDDFEEGSAKRYEAFHDVLSREEGADRDQTAVRAITLNSANYDVRQTIGGGEVRDVMPWEGATDYVADGRQYGVRYEDRHIDWLGETLSEAFGDDVQILEGA